MLAQLSQRIGADTDEKAGHLFIGRKPAKKIIRDRGNRVITAEAFVERRRGVSGLSLRIRGRGERPEHQARRRQWKRPCEEICPSYKFSPLN